jgi:hypothetical protein
MSQLFVIIMNAVSQIASNLGFYATRIDFLQVDWVSADLAWAQLVLILTCGLSAAAWVMFSKRQGHKSHQPDRHP